MAGPNNYRILIGGYSGGERTNGIPRFTKFQWRLLNLLLDKLTKYPSTSKIWGKLDSMWDGFRINGMPRYKVPILGGSYLPGPVSIHFNYLVMAYLENTRNCTEQDPGSHSEQFHT